MDRRVPAARVFLDALLWGSLRVVLVRIPSPGQAMAGKWPPPAVHLRAAKNR